MRRYLIICAAFLTGCVEERLVYVPVSVPADLRQRVVVSCPRGAAEGDLAVCLLRKDAGLSRANAKLDAIDEILTAAEDKK
jgi:hypothetical protein